MNEQERHEMFLSRYHAGDTPWDSGQSPPELLGLLDQLPVGRALDLGCGTGLNVCTMASRGWDACGVDYVPEAIRQAQARGCPSATFAVGDVSRLDTLPLDGPFSLFLDMGCFHGLSDAQRARYAAQVQAWATPDARFLLYGAVARPDAESGPRGIDPDDVAALFAPTFRVVDQQLNRDTSGGWASVWYWLEAQ